MKRQRRLLAALGVAVTVVSMTACAAPDGGDSDVPFVGIVNISGTDDATVQVIEAAVAAAEERGWKTQVIDANGEVDKANTAMQNLVTSGVDAILTTIFPTDSLGVGMAAAKAAGIPVISDGGGPGDGVFVDFDIALGDPMVDLMVETMGGEGDVLNLTYQGGRPCRLRAESVDAGAQANADLVVTSQETPIPGFAEAAVSATSAWLAANPDAGQPQAVFACFDGTALPAITEIIRNGREGINVYSFNGTAEGLQAVQDGTLTATMWFDWTALGESMVDALAEVWDADGDFEPESRDAVYLIVTQDNIEEFLAEHPEAIGG